MSDRSAARRRRRKQRRVMRGIVTASAVVVVALLVGLFIAAPDLFPTSSPSPSPTPTRAAPTAPESPSPVATESPDPIEVEPAVRIAVMGDSGMRNAKIDATAKRMQIEAERDGVRYDALAITGDMVYPDGDSSLTEESVTQPFAQILETAKLVPALGNHDVQSGEGRQIMRILGRDTAYYAEQIGPVRLIALNSTAMGDQKQMAWLRRELAKEQPPGTWTIPVMHHPPYSAGKHGSTKSVQRRWLPLFKQADVRLTMGGHDHDYQRSKPLDGIVHVVTGGAAKLRPAGRADFMAVSKSVFHYVDLLVYKNRIEGRAIDHDGNLVDEFTIER